jgi:hypothetical protein
VVVDDRPSDGESRIAPDDVGRRQRWRRIATAARRRDILSARANRNDEYQQ